MNINLATEPCSRSSDKESRPPVTEMTCSLPRIRLPLGTRSTTAAGFTNFCRGGRCTGFDCGGSVISIPSMFRCVGRCDVTEVLVRRVVPDYAGVVVRDIFPIALINWVVTYRFHQP